MKTTPFCKIILYANAFLSNQLINLISPISLICLISPISRICLISPISLISRIGLISPISPISLILLHPSRSRVIKTMCAPTKGGLICKQMLKTK